MMKSPMLSLEAMFKLAPNGECNPIQCMAQCYIGLVLVVCMYFASVPDSVFLRNRYVDSEYYKLLPFLSNKSPHRKWQ